MLPRAAVVDVGVEHILVVLVDSPTLDIGIESCGKIPSNEKSPRTGLEDNISRRLRLLRRPTGQDYIPCLGFRQLFLFGIHANAITAIRQFHRSRSSPTPGISF